MARAWFFLVLLNSSSFSATRLSISCLTCPSSSWARRTLFSSCSRVPRPPPELPGAPPSPAQGDASACPGRGWSGHAPVNLLLDLSKLKLGTEDLVLLLLEGALGL